MLLGFKKQFAEFVEEGSKTHTIRAVRKIPPRAGEICHCYTNVRQKNMRLLGRWKCTRVQSISIERLDGLELKVAIDGQELSRDEANWFFNRDGFREVHPLTYGKTYEGILIHWGGPPVVMNSPGNDRTKPHCKPVVVSPT